MNKPVPESKIKPDNYVLVIALTGGIASGKSTVSRMFEQLGVPVIDTDIISRDLVEPGKPMLAKLVSIFGKEILGSDQRLNRSKLRSLIFSSKKHRDQLEALMHPAILKEARKQLRKVTSPYCLLVVPLLTEIGGFAGVDRILVVDAPTKRQFSRLTARDGVSGSQAQASLAAQASRTERLAIADDVIDNSGDPDALQPQVEALHLAYLELSNKTKGTSD